MVEPGWVRREVFKNQKIGAARPAFEINLLHYDPGANPIKKFRNADSPFLAGPPAGDL